MCLAQGHNAVTPVRLSYINYFEVKTKNLSFLSHEKNEVWCMIHQKIFFLIEGPRLKVTLIDYYNIVVIFSFRMAPEVIACDENPDATYDNRVRDLLKIQRRLFISHHTSL